MNNSILNEESLEMTPISSWLIRSFLFSSLFGTFLSRFRVEENTMSVVRLSTVAALCAVGSMSFAQTTSYGNIEMITADRLKAHLEFFAHDLLEGRDTPSRGLDISAHYIAAQMKLYGVKPGGDNGTFFQNIELFRNQLNESATSMAMGDEVYELGTHFIPRNQVPGSASGQTIMIPSGYVNEKTGVDPFKGKDISGKIVITDGSLPEGVSFRDVFRSEDWQDPVAAALAKGAKAIIYTSNTEGGQGWQRTVERLTSGGQWQYPEGPNTRSEVAGIPAITASKALSDQLQANLSNGNHSINLTVSYNQETTNTQNVIAIVEGTDPTLKKEYVALGAHYDHVGIGRADSNGDTIYNGADDDGSGSVALIEIAHALAKGNKPKRSVLFVWHCGEEKGLRGSNYFVNNPTVPINSIKSQVNIDMIGRSKAAGDTTPANRSLTGPNEIYAIGPSIIGKRMDEVVKKVNSDIGGFSLNYAYDKVDDPNRFFFRSDHVNYVRKGIPCIFLFSGTHAQYHQASDHVELIDFNKMEKVSRIMMGITFAIAMTDNVPTIENPLNLGGGEPQP